MKQAGIQRLVMAMGVALAVAASSPAQEGKEDRGFRVIGVPHREHGYTNFESQVIGSQKQLDAFVKQTEKQIGWNNREDFLKALTAAKIDFDREALVLVRQMEGSGSNKVAFPSPTWDGKTLVVTIRRESARIGTADIADYCFAVAVDRARAEQVEVWLHSDGRKGLKPRETLRVNVK